MEYGNQRPIMDHAILSHCCPWQAESPQPTIPRERWPVEDGLQWGSDPSFCYHGFSNPIGTWTEERLVQNLMRNMASFCNSVDIGFEPSEAIHEPPQKSSSDLLQLNGLSLPMFQPSLVSYNERLSETPSSSSSPPPPTHQVQRSSPDSTTCSQRPSCTKTDNKGQKKRKCVQRPGQKLCHCRSEKKRREVIGERYKELCHIVPGLEKHSYTRKYVLAEAAIWIQKLLQGNDALEIQLQQLKEQERLNQLRLFPSDEEDAFQ